MATTSTEAKARRLIRDGRVRVVSVTSVDQWTVEVYGDSGLYEVRNTPEDRFCPCKAGARRSKCSHFLAGEAAVVGHLAAESQSEST